jgi:hypothetical protein
MIPAAASVIGPAGGGGCFRRDAEPAAWVLLIPPIAMTQSISPEKPSAGFSSHPPTPSAPQAGVGAAWLDGRKLLLFHAQDNPYLPWRGVADFARIVNCRLRLLATAGHLSTDKTARRYWRSIAAFFARAT